MIPFINIRGPYEFVSNEHLIETCHKLQDQVYDLNQKSKDKIYIEEGYVMYLIDRKGYQIERLYKIKPKDIQEINWTKFDENKKLQIKLAVKKLEKDYNEEDLRKELDISVKDWEIYKKDILTYVDELKMQN